MIAVDNIYCVLSMQDFIVLKKVFCCYKSKGSLFTAKDELLYGLLLFQNNILSEFQQQTVETSRYIPLSIHWFNS